MEYNFKEIESKWQNVWYTQNTFAAKQDFSLPKYYCLVEFPYPSGQGLHVGHPRSYTALDIVARKKRLQGYNVLYPMGWDAFGLPTENFAIKNHIHPEEVTKKNVARFKQQLHNGYSTISLGYAGLCECTRYMTGKSHTDPEAKPFALKVMQHMNDACNKWRAESNIDFSLYGTPLESTTYKFARCLQERFYTKGLKDIRCATLARYASVAVLCDRYSGRCCNYTTRCRYVK